MNPMQLGPLIDCDVHQELAAEAELLPYLSEGWREFVLAKGDSGHGGATSVAAPVYSYAEQPFGYERGDAYPPDGGHAGTSPAFMIEQLCETYDTQAIILTGGEAHKPSALANPYFATEVARAANEHLVDHWLDVDPRFKGSIVPAVQVPEHAAEEVRRCAAAHGSKFVQVILWSNPLPWGFGHPIYDPLHRACVETGLPLGIHSLGEGYAGMNVTSASGSPSLYAEFHTGGAQGLMTHLMSFVFHGVFERYPEFRLVLIEAGVSWLPGFLARMDENWRALRREVPWCKKAPSEYVLEHVRVTTQPFEVSSKDDPTIAGLDAIGAKDILLFASDYPHWDTDAPQKVRNVMPEEWRGPVFRENAAALYGIKLPVAA
jgi:predicted TIM-barrel fold metal-dependent hydrolase